MPLQSTSRPTFGRRVTPQPAPPVRAVKAAEPISTQLTAPVVETAVSPEEISVDQDVQAWKEARGSRFQMPWQQI